MIEETESGTQTLDSNSETTELKLRQQTEREPTSDETSTDELTLRSLDERIKQVTDPIVRRVEELCAFLSSRTEMESAGNSEASGSRRNHEFFSPSRNRYDNRIYSYPMDLAELHLLVEDHNFHLSSVLFSGIFHPMVAFSMMLISFLVGPILEPARRKIIRDYTACLSFNRTTSGLHKTRRFLFLIAFGRGLWDCNLLSQFWYCSMLYCF